MEELIKQYINELEQAKKEDNNAWASIRASIKDVQDQIREYDRKGIKENYIKKRTESFAKLLTSMKNKTFPIEMNTPTTRCTISFNNKTTPVKLCIYVREYDEFGNIIKADKMTMNAQINQESGQLEHNFQIQDYKKSKDDSLFESITFDKDCKIKESSSKTYYGSEYELSWLDKCENNKPIYFRFYNLKPDKEKKDAQDIFSQEDFDNYEEYRKKKYINMILKMESVIDYDPYRRVVDEPKERYRNYNKYSEKALELLRSVGIKNIKLEKKRKNEKLPQVFIEKEKDKISRYAKKTKKDGTSEIIVEEYTPNFGYKKYLNKNHGFTVYTRPLKGKKTFKSYKAYSEEANELAKKILMPQDLTEYRKGQIKYQAINNTLQLTRGPRFNGKVIVKNK